MATVKIPLPILAATPASSNSPAHKVFYPSNYPLRCLAFGTSAGAKSVFWQLRAANYGSGSLTLKIMWYADNASSGDVVWDAQVCAITPDTDSVDVEAESFDTAGTVTDSHLGTTAQRLHTCTVTISSTDSMAADDLIIIKLTRDTDDAADTMANDALVVDVELSYSDT